MSEILTDNIIKNLKKRIDGVVLWEGSLSNSLTGNANAITLSDSINNYKNLEFVVGLNNWGPEAGLNTIKMPTKSWSCPVSMTYLVNSNDLHVRVGVIGRMYQEGAKLAWLDNRSAAKAFYPSGTSSLLEPNETDNGINLYKVIGYPE